MIKDYEKADEREERSDDPWAVSEASDEVFYDDEHQKQHESNQQSTNQDSLEESIPRYDQDQKPIGLAEEDYSNEDKFEDDDRDMDNDEQDSKDDDQDGQEEDMT